MFLVLAIACFALLQLPFFRRRVRSPTSHGAIGMLAASLTADLHLAPLAGRRR